MESKTSFSDILNELAPGSITLHAKKDNQAVQSQAADVIELSPRVSRRRPTGKSAAECGKEYPPASEIEKRTDPQGNCASLSRAVTALTAAHATAAAWETPHDKCPGGERQTKE